MTTSGGSRILEGKVIQVVNERELAINIGSSHGVREGMVFAVLAKSPLVFTDPDTGVILGSEDRPKVHVRSSRVYEKFTVCRTFKTIPGIPGIANFGLANRDLILGTLDEPETLSATKESYPSPLSEEESYVERGDRVVRAKDEE